jgi:hypothetical protein
VSYLIADPEVKDNLEESDGRIVSFEPEDSFALNAPESQFGNRVFILNKLYKPNQNLLVMCNHVAYINELPAIIKNDRI